MFLALAAVIAGLAVGLLTRGSLTAARQLRPVLWWAPLVAAGLYVLPILADDLAGEAVLAALSLATLLVAALANREIAGLGVVAVGIGFNLVPLAIDGATTVGPDAAATVELDTTQDLGVARRIEITEDRVGLLGDRIPLPGTDALVSFGDLIIAVALFDVGLRLTRRRVREPLEVAAASAEAAASAADEDPWFALVRGDIDQRTYAEVTTDDAEAVPAADPSLVPVGTVAPGLGEDPVDRPLVDTGTIRHDEVDLSLVRWADETEHTDADTDELDLRDLQVLLDEPQPSPPAAPPIAAAPTAAAPTNQTPTANDDTAPTNEAAPDTASGFDAALARFDHDHSIETQPTSAEADGAAHEPTAAAEANGAAHEPTAGANGAAHEPTAAADGAEPVNAVGDDRPA